MSAEEWQQHRSGAARWYVLVVVLLTGAGLSALTWAFIQTESRYQPPPYVISASGSMTPTIGASRAAAQPLPLPASRPLSISIPSIGVRSTIQLLGRQQDGSIAVPVPGPLYDQVGWYRYSPTPGSIGPAVLVGHVDSKANGPSVFYRLGTLRPTDAITIRRADGTVASFVVYSVLRFPKGKFPTQLVYGNTVRAELRLITCGGPFDLATGHYLDNVIVLARLQ